MGYTIDQSYEEGIRLGEMAGIVRRRGNHGIVDGFNPAKEVDQTNTRPLHSIGRRIAEMYAGYVRELRGLFMGPGAGREVHEFLQISRQGTAETVALTPFNPYLRLRQWTVGSVLSWIRALLEERGTPVPIGKDVSPDQLLALQRSGAALFYDVLSPEEATRTTQWIGDAAAVLSQRNFQAHVAYDWLGSVHYGLHQESSRTSRSGVLQAWLDHMLAPDGAFVSVSSTAVSTATLRGYAMVGHEGSNATLVLGPESPVRQSFDLRDGTSDIVCLSKSAFTQALCMEENDAPWLADACSLLCSQPSPSPDSSSHI